MFIKFAGEILEFKFSKFTDKHSNKEPFAKDIIETLAYVAIASSDVVEDICLIKINHLTKKRKML